MNKNMIYAAIPFAGVADVALMVKAFAGYSDPTLTVLGVACTIITVLMVLKAFDLLRLPRYTGTGLGARSSQPEVKEVHHHHYHTNRDEDEDCSEEDDAAAYDRGYQDGKDAGSDNGNYDEGYDQGVIDGRDEGQKEGFNDGYEARRNEEETEAAALAKYILHALKMDKEADAAKVASSTIAQAAETPAAL